MKIKLTYFKASGKYYCDGEYETSQEYPFQIYEEVKSWNNGKLPGLSTGKWEGHILISGEFIPPALIPNLE